jgi:hypothetical protein
VRRKQVVWNKNSVSGHVEQKGPRPRQYIPDAELSKETSNKFAPYLQKGSLWRVAAPWFSDMSEPAGYEQPPYPYAQGTDWQPYSKRIYAHGTLAVYLGTTRVEEAKHGGQMLSVLRHTFMIEGNIFLVRCLSNLEPVECVQDHASKS